ncbi:MAG: hypothetical protein ISR69_01905 [Gammaproteobacteria bacterium]|nr:hypothetical protein [Gammaproteobacteria bacterium]
MLLKLIRQSTLFLLSLFAFHLSYAEQHKEVEKELKYYDVEVVIFKNINVLKGPEQIKPRQAPDFLDLYINSTDTDSIQRIIELGYSTPTEDEYRLLEIVEKISRSSRYKLLTHSIWRQPGLAKEEVLPFHIQVGETYGSEYSSIDPAIEPIEEPLIEELTEVIEPVQKLNVPVENEQQTTEFVTNKIWYELEGKITIGLSRYLHAYVDLVLRIPQTSQVVNQISFQNTANKTTQDIEEPLDFSTRILNNFALQEHRRMRSKTLHYLDHPEFGVLILITPYEAPQIESDTSSVITPIVIQN